MKPLVLLQARVSSSRLPGKVLLPLGGIPLAVLAAKRAANTGMNVRVATSTEASDDALVAELERWKVDYYRGSLDDALSRFIGAAEGYSDDTVVVRLTGDNPFPDGDFVKRMVDLFVGEKCRFLTTSPPLDGLPYGMSAEVFRLRDLREADAQAELVSDREHITPWLRRAFELTVFTPFQSLQLGHLRCTVDILDDYLRVAEVFRKEDDVINVNWRHLCQSLDLLSTAPSRQISACLHQGPALVLGTAQLGLDYGIANRAGMPDDTDAKALVRDAIEYGVVLLDTARAYGVSEQRIGNALQGGWLSRVKVITKLPTLSHVAESACDQTVTDAVDANVFRSCRELQTNHLEVLLLHQADHLVSHKGRVLDRLLELQQQGVIGELGASVQTPRQLELALNCSDVSHVQLPFNLLDWRWRESGLLDRLSARPEVSVHVRSVLLQGVLSPLPTEKWPCTTLVDSKALLAMLHECVVSCQRQNLIDLCFAYVRAQSWVNGVVVGIESRSQLNENLHLFTRPPLTQEQAKELERRLPCLPEEFLDPSRWR